LVLKSPVSSHKARRQHREIVTMRHQDRVVIITGGLGGIGGAIVERYLAEGAAVGIVDLDEEAGAARKASLTAAGRRVAFVAADVSRFADCEQAVAAVEAELGPVDTLVLNAGISPKKNRQKVRIDQMSAEEWDRVIGVNLDSAFHFTRLVSPGMAKRRFGRIVTLSSVAGRAYLDTVGVHYSTTKGALIAFTRHAAGELGPSNITVNALAPGRIDTPLIHNGGEQENLAIVAQTPLGRLGKPQEVAAVCVFLTSPEAGFVTGQVIDVAGGWLMT